MSLLVPVVGISAAFVVLGEVPSVGEIVGAVIVVAGCAAGVMARPRARSRSASAAEPTTTSPGSGSDDASALAGIGNPVRSGG